MTTFLILILFFVIMYFVTKDKTTLKDIKNSIKNNGIIIICKEDAEDISDVVYKNDKKVDAYI